jgi:hypothetical protein
MGHAEAGLWLWMGLMLAILCANNLLVTVRDRRRRAQATKRLELALKVELLELSQVYTDNLRLIGNNRGYLISGRSFVSVIRGNLERITTLDEEVISPVIAVFSHNERIEALIAAHSRPRGGAAYSLLESAPEREIRRKYQIGKERINVALAALEGKHVPPPIQERATDAEASVSAVTSP